MKIKKVKSKLYNNMWKNKDESKKVKLEKIESMRCIDPKASVVCNYLWIKSVALGGKCVPFYCEIKQKEILNPKGKRKCEQFEKSSRIYLATHY